MLIGPQLDIEIINELIGATYINEEIIVNNDTFRSGNSLPPLNKLLKYNTDI